MAPTVRQLALAATMLLSLASGTRAGERQALPPGPPTSAEEAVGFATESYLMLFDLSSDDIATQLSAGSGRFATPEMAENYRRSAMANGIEAFFAKDGKKITNSVIGKPTTSRQPDGSWNVDFTVARTVELATPDQDTFRDCLAVTAKVDSHALALDGFASDRIDCPRPQFTQ